MIIHLPSSADDTPPDLPIDLDSRLHTSTYDNGFQSDAPPDLPIESDSQTSANLYLSIMDQRCHTFSFPHYHQAAGASCSILYILVLSLVIFMQSLYTLSNL